MPIGSLGTAKREGVTKQTKDFMMYAFLMESFRHEAVGFSKATFDENMVRGCLRSGRSLKTEPEAGVLAQRWDELFERSGGSEA